MTPRVRRSLTSLLSQLTLQPRTSGSEVRCEEVRISGLSSTTHIYMVSSCPTQYQDSLTERRCRRDVSSDYSYHLDIPVTSLTTAGCTGTSSVRCVTRTGTVSPSRRSP